MDSQEGTKFNDDTNRAWADRPDLSKMESVSYFDKHIEAGQTLFAHHFDRNGRIIQFSIYVSDLHNAGVLPINIEIEQAPHTRVKTNRMLKVGSNSLPEYDVNSGDTLFIRCRDMEKYPFKARDVTVSFRIKPRK